MSDKDSNVVDFTGSSAPAVNVPPQKEMLEDNDRHALETVKLKVTLAVTSAEKALAQNDVAKLSYNNLLLQLAMKYSLTNQDVISEEGEILRGAANKQTT